jgi:branched-chain amino acid transport system ATP-binding protein
LNVSGFGFCRTHLTSFLWSSPSRLRGSRALSHVSECQVSQMLAIARALMAAPQLLMLDEPSMGLAPLVVRDNFKALRHLNRTDLTVLLVEQDVAAFLAISSRGYVLQLGRIVLEEKGKELLEDKTARAIYLGKSVEH